jgi:hypothetical protein
MRERVRVISWEREKPREHSFEEVRASFIAPLASNRLSSTAVHDQDHDHDHSRPTEPSGLAQFVRMLAAEGRAVVSAQMQLPPGEDPEALAVLTEMELRAQEELSGEPPAFSGPAALWATRIFYEACRCAVCRDLSAEHVKSVLGTRCPVERGPSCDWSVDLVFRHFPRFFRFASQLSNGDPLVDALRDLARDWPLSAAGLPGLEKARLDTFIAHPVLCRLYADRLAAAEDPGVVTDPRVLAILRADLGLHRELAPRLAARVFPDASGEASTAGP